MAIAFAQNQRDEVRDLKGIAGALAAEPGMKQQTFICYSIENHPADSRVNIDESGKCQTLTSRMGTGGGNVPMVMERVICLQGNGIDRADTAGCNGKGWKEDVCYTLNTIDRPAVAFESVTLLGERIEGTLMARDYKGIGRRDTWGSAVCIPTPPHYIVRRLTPTECARLQGFPDFWGHPDRKEDFTDEEYKFWLDVRNTHAAINGKAVKDYTKQQMLTWYNKLHSNSAEYKMWGNGIALPCALYVMQGIEEVLMKRYQKER